jgi:hypothetical protein
MYHVVLNIMQWPKCVIQVAVLACHHISDNKWRICFKSKQTVAKSLCQTNRADWIASSTNMPTRSDLSHAPALPCSRANCYLGCRPIVASGTSTTLRRLSADDVCTIHVGECRRPVESATWRGPGVLVNSGSGWWYQRQQWRQRPQDCSMQSLSLGL